METQLWVVVIETQSGNKMVWGENKEKKREGEKQCRDFEFELKAKNKK